MDHDGRRHRLAGGDNLHHPGRVFAPGGRPARARSAKVAPRDEVLSYRKRDTGARRDRDLIALPVQDAVGLVTMRLKRSRNLGSHTRLGRSAHRLHVWQGHGTNHRSRPTPRRLDTWALLPVRRTLDKLGVLPARFYRWDDRYQSGGYEALKDRPPRPKQVWNRIPDDVRGRVLRLALDAPELSPRELATRFIDTEGYFVSEASVYRLLKAHDLITSPAFVVIKAADAFKDKTVRPNQLWQTDFTYLKVIGWGWFYLSTILDDFSRYIIAWKLCTTMRTEDVTDTLELALKASGCDQAKVVHKPRLLSDNGSSYLSGDLAEWLDNQSMEHVRGAPSHPQTQGKIERWHQTLKNRILLENYYLPGDLEAQLGAFVEHYNHRRYHESLNNLTPADVYFGRGQTILLERERIKRKTIEHRRLQHRDAAA